MDVQQALDQDKKIDITTTDRNTGEPHRVEVAFYQIEGKIYFSGRPGTKNWYLNLVENPEFTFHLKHSIQSDLPAKATPIVDEQERRRLFGILVEIWDRQERFDEYLEGSPLVEVELLEK